VSSASPLLSAADLCFKNSLLSLAATPLPAIVSAM
jgi:hypothetical protein